MNHSPTARNAAEQAEALTASLGAQVLGLLLDISLGQRDDGSVQHRIQQTVQSITEAADHLGAPLDLAFKSVRTPLPSDALRYASDLRSTLRTIVRTLAHDPKDTPTESLCKISALVRDSLQEQIAALQKALFDVVVKTERQRGRRGQGLDHAAIEQIDNISSRINLIAVTASIEAARVGEAGRGFAVIAAEIQDLSQQSQQAVRDIRNDVI